MESELVSGFMTEHSAVVFVFFFLAEYASIVLICLLTSILFLGGYLYDYFSLTYFIQFIHPDYYLILTHTSFDTPSYDPVTEGIYGALALGIKTCIMIFIFI